MRSFGKDGGTTSAAIIGSIEADCELGLEICTKMDTILSDTFTGQLGANKRIHEHVKHRTDSQKEIYDLWCIMHTSSNIDKNGQKGLTEVAETALQLTKILFGSSKTSGYHAADIKLT